MTYLGRDAALITPMRAGRCCRPRTPSPPRVAAKLEMHREGAAYGSAEAVLSRAALEEVVATKMAQRTRQQEMREEQGVGGQDEWS